MSTTAPTTTSVVAVAVLFPGMGSLSFDVTLALFVMVPVPEVTTRISTLAVLPERIVPREHVTVVVPEQDPWLGVADWNVTLAGRTSVKVTPVAVLGPVLGISRVYSRSPPDAAGSGLSVLVRARSAIPTTMKLGPNSEVL